MKRNAIALVVILALVTFLSTVPVPSVVAQDAPSAARVVPPTERTVLPIPEPRYPHSTVLDARNATPPHDSRSRRRPVPRTCSSS